ncbi:ribosome silencing factor [Bacteriovoracaceae bacterium]|nr:ribosome silencing factor [Bacteriovoracaceae bacterium]
MNNTNFTRQKFNSIIDESDKEAPLNIAMASSFYMASFKCENIKILKAKENAICDYNIIATAPNNTAAINLCMSLESALKKKRVKIYSLEGLNEGEWVLLDLGDIILHVFNETSRDIYGLDELWSDNENISIPAEYYMPVVDEEATSDGSLENYF